MSEDRQLEKNLQSDDDPQYTERYCISIMEERDAGDKEQKVSRRMNSLLETNQIGKPFSHEDRSQKQISVLTSILKKISLNIQNSEPIQSKIKEITAILQENNELVPLIGKLKSRSKSEVKEQLSKNSNEILKKDPEEASQQFQLKVWKEHFQHKNQETEALKIRIEQLQKQIEDLKTSLNSYLASSKSVETVESLKEKLQVLSSQKREWQNEKADMKQNYQNQTKKLNSLCSDLQNKHAVTSKNLQILVNEYEKKIDELQISNRIQEQHLIEVRTKSEELLARNSQIQEENKKLREDIIQLQINSNKPIESQIIAKYQIQPNKEKNNLEQSEAEIICLDIQLAEEKQKSLSSISLMMQSTKTFEKVIQQLNLKLESKCQDLKQLEVKASRLPLLQQKVAVLMAELEAQKNKTERIISEKKEEQKELIVHKNMISGLRQNQERQKLNIEELERRLESQIQQKQVVQSVFESENVSKNIEIQKLKEEVEELKFRILQLQDEQQIFKQNQQQNKIRIKNLLENEQKLKLDLKEGLKQLLQGEVKFNDKLNEIEKLQLLLELKQIDLSEQLKQINQYKEEQAKLIEKIKQMESHADPLLQSISHLNESLNEASRESIASRQQKLIQKFFKILREYKKRLNPQEIHIFRQQVCFSLI